MAWRTGESLPLPVLLRGALVALVLLAWSRAAAASDVYKCRAADGRISYQDQPCATGEEQPLPRLPRDPRTPTPPATPAPPPTSVDAPAPPPPAAPPPPLPATYLCTRYDGQESYLTDDPVPRRYQVPVWAMLPGSGVSGGLSARRNPPLGTLGAAYTWVEDRCRRLDRDALCAYWEAREDAVRRALRTAFSDTRPALESERTTLREQLATHCGR